MGVDWYLPPFLHLTVFVCKFFRVQHILARRSEFIDENRWLYARDLPLCAEFTLI